MLNTDELIEERRLKLERLREYRKNRIYKMDDSYIGD
jgi:hypothetical protein